jgi:hypothetical protein
VHFGLEFAIESNATPRSSQLGLGRVEARRSKDFLCFSLLSSPVNQKEVRYLRFDGTFQRTIIRVEFADGEIRPWSNLHQQILQDSN